MRLNFVDLRLREPETKCADYAVNLLRRPHADDCSRDRGMAKGPCDGDLTGTTAMSCPDSFQHVGNAEVPCQRGFLEIRHATPEVVLGKVRHALLRHAATEQSIAHR